MTIRVFHGGTDIVDLPICRYGRANLDFGQGFYVTDIREQAIRWAVAVSLKRGRKPLLNIYDIDRDAIIGNYRCKQFKAYDREWLDFIVASRRGERSSREFDYIEGGVANDRVIDTVNLYISGLIDVDTALQRLAYHQPSNQICLLNQEMTDKYLRYYGTEYAE